MLTQEKVKELFDYRDGKLYWKVKHHRNIVIGTQAGSVGKVINYLYRRLHVYGKAYRESHIIWLWHCGYLPKLIDHIDRDALNNNIENLREASYLDNSRNRTSAIGSTSKYLGVHFSTGQKKYRAIIRINPIHPTHLGSFCSELNAAITRDIAPYRHHGKAASLNFRRKDGEDANGIIC